mmetsp:Transcript_78653/g.217455  ORF Transcript_78653/g.217455 Transcript_78653/m.217455 type:complete len:370 (+) Transcript_78653:581-1690(+)
MAVPLLAEQLLRLRGAGLVRLPRLVLRGLRVVRERVERLLRDAVLRRRACSAAPLRAPLRSPDLRGLRRARLARLPDLVVLRLRVVRECIERLLRNAVLCRWARRAPRAGPPLRYALRPPDLRCLRRARFLLAGHALRRHEGAHPRGRLVLRGRPVARERVERLLRNAVLRRRARGAPRAGAGAALARALRAPDLRRLRRARLLLGPGRRPRRRLLRRAGLLLALAWQWKTRSFFERRPCLTTPRSRSHARRGSPTRARSRRRPLAPRSARGRGQGRPLRAPLGRARILLRRRLQRPCEGVKLRLRQPSGTGEQSGGGPVARHRHGGHGPRGAGGLPQGRLPMPLPHVLAGLCHEAADREALAAGVLGG